MSREKQTELLINASKSNNFEVISNKQIEEMAFNLIMATSPLGVKDLTKQFDYNTVAKDLYELYGWRKQIEGEWVKKHRRRGGFETVTGIDSMGGTHTITIDTRCEYDDLYCSICGKQAADNFLNYFPNCGAKMKGGAE